MAGIGDLAGLAAFLARAAIAVEVEQHHALEKVAKAVEAEAKSYPGTYQPGWPALKPETVARKRTGDSPLLESGKMRDSYEHRLVGRKEALVGSNDPNALRHELGTSRMPP